MSIFFIYS